MRVLVYSVLFVAAACVSAFAASRPSVKDAKQELMEADRSFAAATKERGLEGWMSFMSEDAVRIQRLGTKGQQGHEAIRQADAPMFANSNQQLSWNPVDAGIFADSKSGYTTGTYQVIGRDESGKETIVGRGSYVTWWRKDDSGKWQVILDTGAAEATE